MANISQKWLTELTVLNPFTSGYSAKMHASAIARLLKLPQRTVARKLDTLAKLNLIKYTREGKNKLYYFDFNNKTSIFTLSTVEYNRAFEFCISFPKIAILISELAEYGDVLLFGSYAKGYSTSESDIDILFIGRKSKNINNTIKKYPFKASMQYSSYEKFRESLENNNALAKEIAKSHIIFNNVEKYVRLFAEHYNG